jgi:peptidoglycan/xylan/chitin deacetylase (PgdA/CDA1 family)
MSIEPQAPERPGLWETVVPPVKTALMRTGACAALRRWLPSRSIAILRYHAICGEEGFVYADPHLCISPEAFEAHVRYLARHYEVLALPEAVRLLREGGPLPPNAVAFTFDDGYADNLRAARILHRYGATGTFYITAGCMAGGEPFWPAELRVLLRAITFDAISLAVNGRWTRLPLRTAADRTRTNAALLRLYKSNPIPVREHIREQLRELAGHPRVPQVMLTWEEIAEMHRLGMTIGGHTVTHPNLPSAGLVDATKEIAGSRERLERELGVKVTMFSYPNGGAERYFTPELQGVVREAGFDAAATSRNGFADGTSDLYALPRVQVAERLEDLLFRLEVERFVLAPKN